MRARRATTSVGILAVLAAALSLTTSAVPAAAQDGVVKLAVKGQLPAAELPLSIPARTAARAQTGASQLTRTMPTLSAGLLASAKEALDNDAADVAGDTGAPSAGNGGNGSGQPPHVTAGNADSSKNALGAAARTLGCSARNSDGNVRVNQDCTFRRQAEEIIKANPLDSSNLIGGQNDSRLGYNQCGFAYSFDSGKTWGDGNPPFKQRENAPESNGGHTILGTPGTHHTYDFASDPAVTFDSQGRAFFSCIVVDVHTNASGVIVTASPKGAGGSFYNNVPAAGHTYVVVEDNAPGASHDKEFIVADSFVSSPNRDNVYATWTAFKFDPSCGTGPNPNNVPRYCSSPIFGSMSTDHAVTWSKPEMISGTSAALCFAGNFFDQTASPNLCGFDQGSDPAVLPNGDLEVIFRNGNTPLTELNNQQLGVHCHPTGQSNVAMTASNYAHLNCAAPAKVGDDISFGEPRCNFGRGPEECIPGAFIRTNDYPRIAVNRGNGHLYATWQDYCSTRNTQSQTFTTPGGPVTITGFCLDAQRQFDVQVSQSLDGGLTWRQATEEVNPSNGLDHYFPAIDVVPSGSQADARANRADGEGQNASAAGDHVAVSYYRTDQVPNESTLADPFNPNSVVFAPGQPGVQQENSDYAVSGGRALLTPYAERVVSPRFPPPDGIQAGFNGDYSGLVVTGGESGNQNGEDRGGQAVAHPIWSDTRNAVPPQFNDPTPQGVNRDEDVFTTAVPVPDGRGATGD